MPPGYTRGNLMPSPRPRTLVVGFAVLAAAATLGAQTPAVPDRAQVEYERGTRMFADARFDAAYDAYNKALVTRDPGLAELARRGKIRSALRLAGFRAARGEAEVLKAQHPFDEDALTLHADALWGNGLFDEAESGYQAALVQYPGSARARFGVARAKAQHGRMQEALTDALIAREAAPADVEILVLVGELYERVFRYQDAAQTYQDYIDLLPDRLKSNSDVATMKVKLLRSFSGTTPASIDNEAATPLHVVPFTLKNKKIVVDGMMNGKKVQFVLDTGAERTAITRDTANKAGIRAVAETMITGVGAPGFRRLAVARADELTIGTLTIRNFPVSIRRDLMPGVPRWQNETFSPMPLGLSVMIDYQRREVTLGRQLPKTSADFTLPMRAYRLPMVRGVLNGTHSAYFVLDTGGELMSISQDVAVDLGMRPSRRIALKVWGVTGLDRDAFLLPGVNLNFDEIEYQKQGLAVLNLRAPSVLLGFQVGGILGHRFLAGYRVAMDLERGELRLQKF